MFFTFFAEKMRVTQRCVFEKKETNEHLLTRFSYSYLAILFIKTFLNVLYNEKEKKKIMIFSFFFVGWSRDPLSFAQTRIHTSWLKFRCRFIPLVIIVASLFSLKKPPRILTRSLFLFFLLSFFFIPRFHFDVFLFFLSLFPPFTLHLSFLQTSRVTTRCSNQSSNLLPLPILHRERLATIFGKKIDFADKEILCIYISRCPNIYLLPIQL